MRILSCVTVPDEIPVLKKIGVDEVYIAYSEILNYSTVSFKSVKDVIKSIDLARKNDIKIYLAANGFISQGILFSKMVKNIKKFLDYGINGIIISNFGVFKVLREEGVYADFHLSSVNPVFNKYTVDFFHSRFNIKRLILPNQISAKESKGIIDYCKKNNIETEVFYFKFFGCPYINSFCYMHDNSMYKRKTKDEKGLCLLGHGNKKADVSKFNVFLNPDSDVIERVRNRVSFGGSPRILNVSSFFDFYSMGVNVVKYGSRTDSSQIKFYKIKLIKKAVDALLELTAKYSTKEAKIRFMEIFK